MTTNNSSDDAGAKYWRTVRAFDLLRSLHQTFHDQVKTADQKAGYICTFLTILFAYSKEQGNVLHFLNAPPSLSISWIISIIFAASASLSIVFTLMVVLPRKTKGEASSFYWGVWSGPGKGLTLDRLMQKDLDDFVLSQYLLDIQNLARICQAKYKYVNRAFRGTAMTIICFVLIILTR
jgi:hypothetical protein